MGDSSLKALQSTMTKIYFPYSSSSSSSSSIIILYYILDLKSTLSTLHLVIRLLAKNNRHKINIKSTQIDIKKGKPEDFPLKNNLTILVFYPKKDFLASAIRIPSLIIGR